jgi:DNA excision repair protein ERCC-5
MALAAVAKRQKLSSHSSPVKARSAIFPRRPSGSKSRAKTTEVPLFVPDEEDDIVPQVTNESEGGEWEDFDGELEEDVQMSIAIAESLESQNQYRRISDTRLPAHIPALEKPVKTPRQTEMDNHEKSVTDDEDEFASPSRLATQLSIAGARKPLSNRIPSDSARGTAPLVTSTPSISPKKSSQSLVAMPTLDQPPANLSQGDTGDKGESDEDDDMEEISIPRATENRSHSSTMEPALEPPEPPANPGPALATDNVEIPLAIGVEDVVAKGFAELQKIFAEKRRTSQAGDLKVREEMRQTREALRAESPGLEYADDQIEFIEVQEKAKEAIEARSSPPQSDEDEDMEEVEVAAAPLFVPSRIQHSSVQFQHPPPSVPAVRETSPKRVEGNVGEEDGEDVPVSDWSRSPSPRSRPPTGPSTSALTLDRSRGLLDPDDSFDQGPSGEQDQEHEDFDAAHEMDPDAEAGEFARWMSQVKGRNLDDVRKEIEQEIKGLQKEQKAAMRDSEDITSQMIAQIMVSLRHMLYRLNSPFWIWIRCCIRR